MSFHILDFNYKKDERIVEQLFKPIKQRNTILFLGAGASVTDENKFLSQDIMDLYESKTLRQYHTKDIVEFVDILSSTPGFNRNEFDQFVDSCLRKLRPNSGHNAVAKLNWRAIITTNYDLLLERSFQEIDGTSSENLKLRIIRHQGEYHTILADDEVAYYKLNGCIDNKKDFPLIFSTEDFRNAEPFYKVVLKPLKNISSKVNFLSIGYSYSDLFAKKLLANMDNYNFRDKRTFYNVDPYINDDVLPLFEQKQICVVKTTMEEFFNQYENWEEESGHLFKLSAKNYYTNSANAPVYLPDRKLLQRIDNNLIQLNEHYRSKNISQTEFYKGEEPNFLVIERNYDVVKNDSINKTTNQIFKLVDENKTRIIPMICLTGTFGTGKSTFAYRLIKKIISDPDKNASAFEIIDPSALRSIDLKDFFKTLKNTYIILYVNTIELNSVFKSLIDLRTTLSIDNSPDYKILILLTARENILEKLKYNKDIKNGYSIKIDCPLTKPEAIDLVSRLKQVGLIEYRDLETRESIVKKVLKEYAGDSYLSLLELINGSKLIDDLTEAYEQLGNTAQEAFIYTSMLYQFKIPMPSGLLKSLVKKEWDDFQKEVIEIDGKGILIQDDSAKEKHVGQDLYFRTKHPLISEKLINNTLRDEDTKFSYAKRIVTHTNLGEKSSTLLVNFFKALEGISYFPVSKINSLYDSADNSLASDPHFVLHYAINLQRRRTVQDLRSAIEKIIYAESFNEKRKRNHYLIHRRGVLNFELAKLLYENNGRRVNFTIRKHINESRDLLEIKQILAPSSSYSFYDLISLDIWCLEHMVENEVEEAKLRITIDELFELASKVVYDNSSRIIELQQKYVSKFNVNSSEEEYLIMIEDKFGTEDAYPYGLILKFNFYSGKEKHDKAHEIIELLESYNDNAYVVKTLFIYYGRLLHVARYRIKFFALLKNNPELQTSNELRANYFLFIAECYNYNFDYAREHLSGINSKFDLLNPDFSRDWIDEETGDARLFDGILKINRKGRKVVFVSELNRYFFFNKLPENLTINGKYQVLLKFFLYGIRAEMMDDNNVIETDERNSIEIDGDEAI